MPKISVIMPTYHHRETVGAAIQSVLDQSYGDFELLLIDDGSTDGTDEVLERFRRNDPRIRIFRNEQNSGSPAKICNEAAKNRAAGEFLAFQFDDDYWFRWCLASLAREADRNDFVYGQTIYINFLHHRLQEMLGVVKIDKDTILERNRLANNAVLIRRSVFLELGGFDENPLLKRVCDWELWIRVVFGGYRICRVPELVSICYAFQPNSLSSVCEYDVEAVKAYIRRKLGLQPV